MKKILFILLFIVYSVKYYSQEASGNLRFQSTNQSITINVQAKSLFDNGQHTYDFSVPTNFNYSFGPWQLDQTASLNNYFSSPTSNVIIVKNGSNFLNAYINVYPKTASITDLNGRNVGKPTIVRIDDTTSRIYMDASKLSNGLYVVIADKIKFKFLKTDIQGINYDIIDNKLNFNSKPKSNNYNSKAQNDVNYNISWNENIDMKLNKIVKVFQGNKDVYLEDNTNNSLVVPVESSILGYTGDVVIRGAYSGTYHRYLEYTLVNQIATDSIYTFYRENYTEARFNVHINDGVNPNPYKLIIKDKFLPKRFYDKEIIIDLYHDHLFLNRINGYKDIVLEKIPKPETSGDVVISTKLKGSPYKDVKVTLKNLKHTDSIYTKDFTNFDTSERIFWDIYVDSADGNDYEVKVTDLRNDGTFIQTLDTIKIYQDERELENVINGTKNINLNIIPNNQEVTIKVRNFENLEFESEVKVELIKIEKNELGHDVDTLFYSKITDTNGEVIFQNVPGEGTYKTRTSKEGHYTKTVGQFSTPKVDLISEMYDYHNTLTVPKFNYEDNTLITADTINKYRPRQFNTELILGHCRVYVSNSFTRKDSIVQHFKEIAEFIGFPDAFIFVDTPFPWPQYGANVTNYNPYPKERNVFSGVFGFNIIDGSSASVSGNSINRVKMGFQGEIRLNISYENNRTEMDYYLMDHEVGHMLGFDHQPPMGTFKSAMSYAGYEYTDSKYDKSLMPFWYKLAKYHFDTVDENNKLLEYGLAYSLTRFK